jgi:hypothetical protein
MARKLLLTAVLVNALARLALRAHVRRCSHLEEHEMVAKFLIGAVLLTAAAPAYAEAWDFVLMNKTGKTIKTIELSDSGKAEWAQETLDADMVHDPVRPGTNHTVHFDKKACAVDVRLTFNDDSQAVFSNFNACDNAFGDFSFKGEAPVVKGS